MKLVLIGYMGSGKSIVGKKLAQQIGTDFIDLDRAIEQKNNQSIRSLFEARGEIFFRKTEAEVLRSLMDTDGTLVLATGGGTPCYAQNMDFLLGDRQCRTIYLKASIPTLTERLFEERHHRPLIAHLEHYDQLTEFIGKHLFERAFFYNQSEQIVPTDGKDVDQVVKEIVVTLF